MVKVIEEYKIPKSQIEYLTSKLYFLPFMPSSSLLNTPNLGDNHGSNNKLCQILQKHFPTWNATQYQIRCIGHIINLAVQAFLFYKDTEAVKIAIRAAEELQREE